MDKLFTVNQLEKYRFNPSLEHTFNVADLLDEKHLRNFLENLSVTIGAPSEKIAASIFIKRYAFLAVMSLYAMTALNKKLNVSLDNIKMETAIQGKDWLPGISLKDADLQGWDGNDRAEWRTRVLKDLFANNVYPLISQLEKTFGISKLILWENIAVYLFWLYETELIDYEQAAEDFRYLLSEAEGKLFGRYNLNPLQKYFAEKTYLEEWDTEVRVRKTCCFTYQMPAGKRCKTCPCTHIAKDRRCHDGENICEAVRSFA
ncbi:IucA/IucC family C-terminal-domain containing protein [Neobacillus sp. SuZ13]|uniref:IucA/IucC family C-terminal-domain containing protein n=1 Tax=Neobacillus sp. SuZ13 TaxID=3047875 RepID=UPI0024BFE10E|nr:IucA/IucC family C-terminal-domain containing protein [Neobacillus sp. SuZ13]WHY66237.1 IucA/IucC family C-terminal-domain containing protein [Neobacillus sp. SuZ13]